MTQHLPPLKSCPFCGGEPAYVKVRSHVLRGAWEWFVSCSGCRACVGLFGQAPYFSPAEIAAVWNRRLEWTVHQSPAVRDPMIAS
jgi:Lar family restriction alleviation protein